MPKKHVPILTYLFPRIQDAVFVGTLIAISIQGTFLLNGDGDLGRHITIGNYIINHREIPTRDIFSHTMTGQHLVPHEWLAQLILGVLHAVWGLTGVVWMIAVLIAGTFTLTYREMLRRNVFRTLALFIALLAASASSLHWLARPHIFTFLFSAVWAYQLENRNSKLWLFPLLMLVWANTHGAFVVGFLIWGAHMAGWLWEYLHGQSTTDTGSRLIIIGASSLAVTLVNPAGWQLWGTSIGYVGNRFLIDQTLEYQAPNFHNWSTWPFLIMLAVGILMNGFGGRLRPHEALLFAGWTVLSLYSARNIPLFAIITAPFMGSAVQSALGRSIFLQGVEQRLARIEGRMRGVFWPVASIVLLTIATCIRPDPANRFNPDRFPVAAVDWLSVHPQEGRMFNNFIWGGYILYRMWPEQRVFIDGQTDFYGETLTLEYIKVTTLAEGWETVLAEHQVSWLLVQPDKPVVKALQEEMGWLVMYRDDTAVILRAPSIKDGEQ